MDNDVSEIIFPRQMQFIDSVSQLMVNISSSLNYSENVVLKV